MIWETIYESAWRSRRSGSQWRLRPLHTIGYTHVKAGLEELVRTRRIYVYEGQAADLRCKKKVCGFPIRSQDVTNQTLSVRE